jgi:hypothetical protein
VEGQAVMQSQHVHADETRAQTSATAATWQPVAAHTIETPGRPAICQYRPLRRSIGTVRRRQVRRDASAFAEEVARVEVLRKERPKPAARIQPQQVALLWYNHPISYLVHV